MENVPDKLANISHQWLWVVLRLAMVGSHAHSVVAPYARSMSGSFSIESSLVLIGLRGCGKSTLAQLIAEQVRTHRPVDLDAVVKQRMGAVTITDAWRDHGEGVFRAHEREALAELLGEDRLILALGGGTPTAPGAADLLCAARSADRCCIIYIRGDAGLLRGRLVASGTADRPALVGASPLDEIEQLLLTRDPLYRSLASAIVPADQPIGELVTRIIDLWLWHGRAIPSTR